MGQFLKCYILREVVATEKPIECEGDGSRSLIDMTSRIPFPISINSLELFVMFPKMKLNHQKNINYMTEKDFTERVIKRRCFPSSEV